MLEIVDLTIEVGLKTIIKDLSFVVNKNDKLAIIGEEGNGKSTLLKAIVGHFTYGKVRGIINLKNNTVGYLEQSINDIDLEKDVFDYLFIDKEDYYNKTNSLYKILNLLNIKDDFLEKGKVKLLSGGEKVKLQLLKLLLEDVDILILDEPTNDLDIETLEWLEGFINITTKPVIYVSHDETLLSKTANMILHLELVKHKEEPRWTVLRTDYNTYVNSRIRSIEKNAQVARKEYHDFKKQKEKLSQVMNKVHHQQETITRADPHGGKMLKRKMKSIKTQEKRMDKNIITEVPDVEESISFSFSDISVPRHKKILELEIGALRIHNKVLSNNIELTVIGNSHIVIIGNNGSGKTTLLNIIYNELKNRSDIVVGYMRQNYDEELGKYKTPLDFLCNTGSKDEISYIRTMLGNMNFTKEEMTTNISNLSGGSKAKLYLLKLMINKCNVLILDEPTRNLSPLSNPIIRKALKEFKGTIISVSHDRKYIEEVCNIIYELKNEGLVLKEKTS